MPARQLTSFTPDARATMPRGWEQREKGPDDNFIVNCIVCCLVQALTRPIELCLGKDETREVEASKLPKIEERGESQSLSQKLRMAVQRIGNSSPIGPIAFIGDSDIEWWEPWHLTSWKPDLKDSPTIPVVNLGVGGGNLEDLLLRAEEIDSQLKPIMYVIISGENSLLGEPDCTVGRCAGMLRLLLTRLSQRPRSHLRHLVFFSSKRAPGTTFMHKKHLQYNEKAQKICEELNAAEVNNTDDSTSLKPRFIFHDLAQDSGLYPDNRGLYRVDGLHLNKQGYLVLNNRLQQILQESVSLEDLQSGVTAS